MCRWRCCATHASTTFDSSVPARISARAWLRRQYLFRTRCGVLREAGPGLVNVGCLGTFEENW